MCWGETQQFIPLIIKGDGIQEGNESFDVLLSNATNASISRAQASVTISETPLLSIDDVTVSEAGGTARFTVTSTRILQSDATLSFHTQGKGGGFEPIDNGTITIAAGAASANIEVTIRQDDQIEDDEQFMLVLDDATNAQIGKSIGTGTILDDEAAGSYSIVAGGSTAEGDNGATDAVFTVTLADPAPGRTATVSYTTVNATALARDPRTGQATLQRLQVC